MVARMLFVSQLTLSHSIFGTPSAKMSIYAKLARTIYQGSPDPLTLADGQKHAYSFIIVIFPIDRQWYKVKICSQILMEI
jgi:hypothetical protein